MKSRRGVHHRQEPVGGEGARLTRVRVATVLCGSEAHVGVVQSGGRRVCGA